MKRLCMLAVLTFVITVAYSQIEVVKAGFILVPQATTNGKSFDFNQMAVATPLLSNVLIATPKTYHNICYAWGGNALVLVNGWVYHPEGKQDIYLVTTKNFGSKGGNVLLAWEIQLVEGNIPAWLALEFGTSWKTWNTSICNVSLTIPFDAPLWKRGK